MNSELRKRVEKLLNQIEVNPFRVPLRTTYPRLKKYLEGFKHPSFETDESICSAEIYSVICGQRIEINELSKENRELKEKLEKTK